MNKKYQLKMPVVLLALFALALPAFASGAEGREVGQKSECSNEPLRQVKPEEQMASAQDALMKMDGASQTLRRQLSEARKSHDVLKTLCLDDKLSQVDVAYRSAKDRSSSVKSALEQKNFDQSTHEHTVLMVLRQRVSTLLCEANSCIGEEANFLGDTKTNLNVDPSITQSETGGYIEYSPGSIAGGATGGASSGAQGGGLTDLPQCISCTL